MIKVGVWIIIVIQSRVIMVCRGHIAALNGDGKRVLQDGVKVCGLWQWIDQVCCVDTWLLFQRTPRVVHLCARLPLCLSVLSVCLSGLSLYLEKVQILAPPCHTVFSRFTHPNDHNVP